MDWTLRVVERNSEDPRAPAWVGAMMNQCWRSRAVQHARCILAFIGKLPPVFGAKLLDAAVSDAFLLSLDEGADFSVEFTSAVLRVRPEAVLHELLRGRAALSTAVPPCVVNLRGRLDLIGRRSLGRKHCIAAFRFFLVNHMLAQRQRNKDWLAECPPRDWLPDFLTALEEATAELAEAIHDGRVPGVDWLYERLTALRGPPQFGEGTEEGRDFVFAASDALIELGIELLCYRRALNLPSQLQEIEMRTATSSDFYHSGCWLTQLASQRRAWLSSEALAWLVHREHSEMQSRLEEFSSRAEAYRLLAIVSGWHREAARARECTQHAAENHFTHGDQMLLFNTLQAVKYFAGGVPTDRAGGTQGETWLLQLAVPIHHLSKVVAADHTGELKTELARVILQAAPQLFLPYYRSLCLEEQSYCATRAFDALIEQIDLADPLNQALARTALDRRALKAISARAAGGDQGAADVKAALQRELGEGAFEDLEYDHPTSQAPGERLLEPPPVPDSFPPSKLVDYLKLAG